MIHEGMKNVAAGANPMIIKKGIDKAVTALVDEIKAKSKKVEGQADIAQVATISSANEETGKLIAEAMEKVGKDGVITVEESKTMKTNLSVKEGMQFDRGYIYPVPRHGYGQDGGSPRRSVHPHHGPQDFRDQRHPADSRAGRQVRQAARHHR